jgi:hypothetical protein
MYTADRPKTSELVFLDPFSPRGAAALPYRQRLNISKSPLTIGLMSNLFVDASIFLDDLRAPLKQILPHAAFSFYDKGHMRNSSFPAPVEQIKRIALECDAVVCAYGHCGSCTGGTVRDAVALAREGTPVVALVTRTFLDEALFLTRAGGIPDVPILSLPHKMAGQDKAMQQAVANAVAPGIVLALTQGQSADASTCLAEARTTSATA